MFHLIASLFNVILDTQMIFESSQLVSSELVAILLLVLYFVAPPWRLSWLQYSTPLRHLVVFCKSLVGSQVIVARKPTAETSRPCTEETESIRLGSPMQIRSQWRCRSNHSPSEAPKRRCTALQPTTIESLISVVSSRFVANVVAARICVRWANRWQK